MPKAPPMYKQYKNLKAVYPNALLFYRLGDFYELFEEDAETGSRELGLTLTKRRFSKELTLPMAGVPHRHVNGYISRLIDKGYMVAVADQLEDARKAKGLVKRGIVRVVTSGTIMDQPMLKDYVNNYLLALLPEGEWVGLAFVDISTGEFACACFSQNELLEEVARIRSSEVILPDKLLKDETFCQSLKALGVARLTPLDLVSDTQALLKEHFQVASLEAYGENPLALGAAGIILHYLKTNQLSDLAHITSLTTYHPSDYMALDTITRRNLELTHTLRDGQTKGALLNILDHTKTRMGTRLLRRWMNHPLRNPARIQARLDAVEALVNNAFLRQDLRALLSGMYDLERLAGRIGYGNANGRDLVNLKTTLARVPEIKSLLKTALAGGVEPDTLLAQLLEQLNPLTTLIETIESSLVDEPPILLTEGGLIKPGFHPELESLRQTALDSRNWLAEYETAERERTGIKNLRIKYNQVFGFFIEVTKSNLSRAPKDYRRRATVTNAERFVTPELKAREATILAAEDEANELEYDIFLQVRRLATEHLAVLRQTAGGLAQLDILLSLAEVSVQHNYVKPELTVDTSLWLRDARHPVVEQSLSVETPFVPNDCDLGHSQRLIVLTGPNMSGKSVYLRQTALAALMAQMGSFVAASAARIGLADRIFVRAGASDDISQGRSTFLVEMSETAHILHHATEQSLVILDEVGRGTSTYDGMSLAWAVAEDIYHTIRARCLFATHFHEMTGLGDSLPQAANYSLAVRERQGQVIFLRKLIASGADKSYGIHVARLAGLPDRVLQKASERLASLEQQKSNGPALQPDQASTLAEQPAAYSTDDADGPNDSYEGQPVGDHLILRADDPQVWQIIDRIYGLDIANLTPIAALVQLNEWQQKLKKGK